MELEYNKNNIRQNVSECRIVIFVSWSKTGGNDDHFQERCSDAVS